MLMIVCDVSRPHRIFVFAGPVIPQFLYDVPLCLNSFYIIEWYIPYENELNLVARKSKKFHVPWLVIPFAVLLI